MNNVVTKGEKMELKDLLKEMPYKWRVQSFSKFKPTAQCVAYIDARDVMVRLDSVCGADNWQSDYKEADGKLFAGIGIFCGSNWVWKWDAGTESNIEKEKGQSSDAFKRAGVKWGIGRFLYALKIHTVASNEKKASGNYPYVVDHSGKRVWDITEYINELKGNAPKIPEEEIEEYLTCDELIEKLKETDAIPHLNNIGKKYMVDYSKLTDAEQKKVKEAKEIRKAEILGVIE